MRRALTFLVVFTLLISMLPSATVDAQSPITILEQSLITTYKTSAVFHLKVATTAGTITKVRLIWHGRGFPEFSAHQNIALIPDKEVVAEYTWPMQGFAFVPWDYLYAKWEITDSAGNKLVTPDTGLQVTDSTRPWKELKEANIAVYTYDQPDSVARDIIASARPVYDRMVNELAFTPSDPLVIVLYNAPEDLCVSRLALDCDPGRYALVPFYISGPGFVVMWVGNDPAEFTNYLQASIANSMLYDWMIVPSLVATNTPNWFFTGIYQHYLLGDQAARIQHIRDLAAQGKLLHFDQFSAAYEAANVARDKARLTELQAMEGSTIAFIVDKVGEDGLMKLFMLMKAGKKTDAAVKELMGYDVVAFEVAWSEWLGAKDPFVLVPTPTDAIIFPPTPTFPPKK